GVAHGEDKHDGVDDAGEAEEVERGRPVVAFGDDAAETAEALADEDAGHVDAGGEGAGGAAMVVGDEGERGGQIKGLADAHQRAGDEKLFKGLRVRGEPGDDGPGEQAADDDAGAAELVGEEAGDGAEATVDPE